jgi:hypothetical protein
MKVFKYLLTLPARLLISFVLIVVSPIVFAHGIYEWATDNSDEGVYLYSSATGKWRIWDLICHFVDVWTDSDPMEMF